MNKKVAIVQARFGSTRLPGKILKALSGKPMLWHVINRLSFSKLIDKTVIATTEADEDNLVELFCIENNIPYFRGSVDNVLSRYYETAKVFGADIIIRITSDCPLIDPTIIDRMLKLFVESSEKFDYLSNVLDRTFPRGLDTEIFSFNTLEQAYYQATNQYEQEHVTPFIYQHPEIFQVKNYYNDKDLSFHRWTVDTQEDFEFVTKVYDALYKSEEIFLTNDVLKLLEDNPELIKINQHIQQKNS